MRSYSKMPKTIGAYADCKRVLDAALTKNGALMTFATRGAAAHFRHRCNAFRRLMFNAAAEAQSLTPGVLPTTIYDPIYMVIDPKEPTVVRIYPQRPAGNLTTLDGEPIEQVKPLALDQLEEDAAALREELGFDL